MDDTQRALLLEISELEQRLAIVAESILYRPLLTATGAAGDIGEAGVLLGKALGKLGIEDDMAEEVLQGDGGTSWRNPTATDPLSEILAAKKKVEEFGVPISPYPTEPDADGNFA